MDLFASNPVLKLYRVCLPENSPELCNLDSCLNEDLHKAVDCHVRYTYSFHKLDPNVFSIATLKKGTLAYLIIFDPIDSVEPSSKLILSNRYDVLTSIKYIVDDEDCIIPDVKNVKTCGRGVEENIGR